MLKKLRIKFIVTTMIAVILILSAIMVTVNAVNYATVLRSTDEVVDLLTKNEGKFPVEREEPKEGPGQRPPEREEPPQKGDRFDLPKNMSEETPFETRFFTVFFSEDEVIWYDLEQIASVDESEAEEMARKVLSKSKDIGTYGIYRYKITETERGKMVLFVDMSKQLEPMRSFLLISLIVMVVCILLFFVGVVFLSKPLLKPIIESYTRQKRFITDAGHELKTPLTIISANNEIQEYETGETECTKAISKQVSRMTTMVKNLTELAKMDEEAREEKTNFDLSGAFTDVASSVEKVFEKSGKKLTLKCKEGIKYYGVEGMIRRLFCLLLENAAKYSLSYAVADLQKRGKQVILTITNDAEGIAPGDQSKCFERFYRSDEARSSQTEGSGIGLSIAKEIVRIHKGKITAEGTAKGEFFIKVVL